MDRKLDPDDLIPDVPQDLRLLMLDVILVWARLDGAISQLYAALFGLADHLHTDDITSMRATTKLTDIRRRLDEMSLADASRTFRKFKRVYERHSDVRNTIAHSACAGVQRSDPRRIVFATYRAAFAPETLLIEAIHEEQFDRAERWGRRLTDHLLRLSDSIRAARGWT